MVKKYLILFLGLAPLVCLNGMDTLYYSTVSAKYNLENNSLAGGKKEYFISQVIVDGKNIHSVFSQYFVDSTSFDSHEKTNLFLFKKGNQHFQTYLYNNYSTFKDADNSNFNPFLKFPQSLLWGNLHDDCFKPQFKDTLHCFETRSGRSLNYYQSKSVLTNKTLDFVKVVDSSYNDISGWKRYEYLYEKITDTGTISYIKGKAADFYSKTPEELGFTLKEQLPFVSKLNIGDTIQNFVFLDMSFDSVRFSDIKADYILIDLWFTSCKPCVKYLQDLPKIKPQLNENIAYASINTVENDTMLINRLFERIKLDENVKNDVLLDFNNIIRKEYNIYSAPYFIILNKDLVVVDMIRGYNSPKAFVRKVKKSLR